MEEILCRPGVIMPKHIAETRKRRERARHLAPLRSVSKAYRRSDVLTAKSNKMEVTTDVPRQAAENPARGSAEERHPGNQGAAASQAVSIPIGYAFQGAAGGVGASLQGAGAGLNLGLAQQANQAKAQITAMGGIYLPPTPAPVAIKTQVVPGEIIAWRSWIWDGQYLLSTTRNMRWKPGKPMQGNVDAGVGVHAAKTREYAENYAGGPIAVVGKVSLWGKVAEHEWGYRAEYGAVHSIEAVGSGMNRGELDTIRRLYKVDQEKTNFERVTGQDLGMQVMLTVCLLLVIPVVWLAQNVSSWMVAYALSCILAHGFFYAEFHGDLIGLRTSGIYTLTRRDYVICRTVSLLMSAAGPLSLLIFGLGRMLCTGPFQGWRLI